jgi:DNA polymerase-1
VRKAPATASTLICSKDKDILQLLDHNIRTYDIKTGKITDSVTMKQEMGIAPKQIIDCLALEGDAIDNVPGVPLIGEKTARELIRQYGDLDNLYAHADEIKGKRGENLRNARTGVFSRSLVPCPCRWRLTERVDRSLIKTAHGDLHELVQPAPGQLGAAGADSAQSAHRSANSRWSTALGGDSEPPQPGAAVLQEARDLTRRGSAGTLAHTYTLVDTPEKFNAFLAELRKQTLISVDTETTSRNAMRAELVGLSFS